ncbi:MAG: hypothetical protein R3C32_05925 [Chloroflexota bacterium]
MIVFGLDQLHRRRTTVEVLDGLSVDGSHLDDDVQLVGDEFERAAEVGRMPAEAGSKTGARAGAPGPATGVASVGDPTSAW